MANKKLHILFMCASNACRSQIAEGFTEKYKGDTIEAFSAGHKPATRISKNAVKVMAEAGIDVSDYYPKHISDLAGLKFDYIITMCDSIRHIVKSFSTDAKVVHRGFQDPSTFIGSAEETLEQFRKVRDEIKEYVLSLPESLEK